MMAKEFVDLDSFRRRVNGRCEDCKRRMRLDKLICAATRRNHRRTGLDLLCMDCVWKRVDPK